MWEYKVVPGQGIQLVQDIYSQMSEVGRLGRLRRIGVRGFTEHPDLNSERGKVIAHALTEDRPRLRKMADDLVHDLAVYEVVSVSEEDGWLARAVLKIANGQHPHCLQLESVLSNFLNSVDAPWDVYPPPGK